MGLLEAVRHPRWCLDAVLFEPAPRAPTGTRDSQI